MGDFKGIAFKELGESALYYPRFGRRALSTIQRPPSPTGGRTIIQSSGQKEANLSLDVELTEADAASMDSAVDTTGSLTWSGGTRSVYLQATENVRERVVDGKILATLVFVGL